MHLRILLKVHSKVQTDAKSGPLKREGKSELPCFAKETADGTRTNASEGALDSAWKSTLKVHFGV